HVLQHVLGLALVIQDTKTNAKKLRRGVLVDHAQCRTIPGGDAREGGGELAARCLCVHACAPASGLTLYIPPVPLPCSQATQGERVADPGAASCPTPDALGSDAAEVITQLR